MTRDLALTERDGSWPVDRYAPGAVGSPEDRHSYSPSLDFATILRIAKEWRWLILGAVALGMAIAIVVTLLTTPLYRAWVTLEVSPPAVEVMSEESDRVSSPNSWELIATQVSLLKSRSLAEKVAQDLNLASNPNFLEQAGDASSRLQAATSKVHRGMNVEPPDEGRVIRFNYVAQSPQLAAQAANAIAAEFINSNLQRRYEASAYARNFLQRQIVRTRADLERSERQLVGYAQAQGIINTSTGDGSSSGDASSLQGASLIALNQALAEVTARRIAAEGAYRQARSTGATAEVNESTQTLRQSKAALEADYQEKRAMMKPEHPEMLSLRSRIDELGRQISREVSNVASGRANSLLADYRAALASERALQGRVAALKGDVLDLRGRSIQYTILQREVDTNRALYDALLQRYKEIGVAGGIGTAPVSIVDPAQPPGVPYKPNLILNILLGLGLGFLAGMLAAVGLEFLNDTIKTRADVRNKLRLACLGAIPKRAGKETFLGDLKDPASEISEAYSTVVASLGFSTERGIPKSILVTSSRPAEGKSSSALALAQNFARRGKSVLLIDGDLRKPAFKVASDKLGLSKLLTTNEQLTPHVAPTPYENLCLLASGPLPPNPADLLSTGRFQSIMREACAHFDVVVVDGPPVLGLADSTLLASVCKDVMFVVESGKTRTAAATEALDNLRAAGAHILGVTLTKSTEEANAYGYGYGYGPYRHRGAVEQKRREILMIPE
ncbi:MAG TPA: polysaccharide biosynthesis tyrosine autokinase [Sphingomicrobium sp.]|nr:polysaccharide biosynthesis tyrosine autokinase [Sphingomicrobium sp.]